MVAADALRPSRLGAGDVRRLQLERPGADAPLGTLDLRQQRRNVDSPMSRCIRREPPRGLLELPRAARAVAPAGLVPGNGDVDEPLEEVTLARLGCPPLVLELLVRSEELAAADQLNPALEARP